MYSTIWRNSSDTASRMCWSCFEACRNFAKSFALKRKPRGRSQVTKHRILRWHPFQNPRAPPIRCILLLRWQPPDKTPKHPARKRLVSIRSPTSPFLKRVWQPFDTSTWRKTSLRTFLIPSTFIRCCPSNGWNSSPMDDLSQFSMRETRPIDEKSKCVVGRWMGIVPRRKPSLNLTVVSGTHVHNVFPGDPDNLAILRAAKQVLHAGVSKLQHECVEIDASCVRCCVCTHSPNASAFVARSHHPSGFLFGSQVGSLFFYDSRSVFVKHYHTTVLITF